MRRTSRETRFQSAYNRSASANASYQAAALQLTLHADAAASDNGSYPISEGQSTITMFFSLSAASSVTFNATLAQAPAAAVLTSTSTPSSLGDFPITADSEQRLHLQFYKSLNLSAGNYAIDFAAGCNSGTVNGTASVDLTVTLGTSTPPHITSANNVTFQIGKPSAFTITTTGDPTPTITETAFLPDGIKFVDNGNGTATLSGTPSALDATGNYDLIFTASNGVPIDSTHPAANQFFTLTLSKSGVKAPLPATHLVFGTQPGATTNADARR